MLNTIPDYKHYKAFVEKLKRRYSYCDPHTIESWSGVGYTKALTNLDHSRNIDAYIMSWISNTVKDGVQREYTNRGREHTNAEGRLKPMLSEAPSPLEVLLADENKELIQKAMKKLSETEKFVLLGRAVDGVGLETIGKRIGRSKERARQLYDSALAKMHLNLKEHICEE